MALIGTGLLANVQITVTGLSTLASATYVVSPVIFHGANQPLDVLVEVAAASTNVVAGNKQLLVFAKASIDGTNYSSGPESGTTTTDEPDLFFVGSLPLLTSTTTHRKIFSLANAYGGILPLYSKLVFKNDMGVAMTSAAVQYSEVMGTSV